MISKYENINNSHVIVGYKLLAKLNKKQVYNIEILFQEVKKELNIDLEFFLNGLFFLYLIDTIVLNNNVISYKKPI